ncbi:MAG: hypothetical protein AAF416_03185 [Pseudomonadota bacterium]
MSAGLVTLNAGFQGLRRRAPLLFWPVVFLWTAIGGLGHGLAMHYLDTRAVVLLYPISAAALLWPVLVDTGLGRLRGTVAAGVLAALLWWMSWIGWHVAEGARPEGPFTGMAWVSDRWEGNDPYAFDPRAGAAAGMAFARLPPKDWIPHFQALSETKKIREPGRRRGRGSNRRLLTAVELRRLWIAEPFVLWGSLLIAVWPRKADRLLNFLRYLSPRQWRRRR